MKDFAAIALQYAQDVSSGKILACKEAKQAAQRHINDLARQGEDDFPYVFNPEAGAKVCRFAELFNIFEGPLAGQKVKLMDWQTFLIMSLYGWLRQGTSKRRFRRAYVEIPRGNAKSMTAAILALYMLGADGEGGAQVLSAGATKTISDVSFIAAQNLLAATPDMVSALGLVVQSKTITQPRRASRFWATPAKVSASDGKNCHAVIFDEGHSVTDRRIYDSLKTAMAKRDNNLFLMITTAGDCGTLCHEQHDYISEILDGTHTDELAETTFGIIYTIPDGMDWRDPIAHQAANPAWGITVMPDMIKHECQQAIATPSAQNNFKTKYLCCWVSGAEAFFDMEKWNKCRDTAMRLEDFEGERCFLGLDHASKIDLSAKVYLFPRQENGETHYYAFTKCYLPQATVDSGKNAMYQGWAHQGHLTVHEGERISDFDIIDDIIDDIKTYAVAEIGYDPAKAGAIAEGVMRSGFDEIYEVRQNAMTLSEPLKELQALVNAGRFHHNCPIFDWCAANVEVKEDNNSNIYPRKAGLRRENKVDLIFATLDALVRALFHDEESEWSVYNERGIVFA